MNAGLPVIDTFITVRVAKGRDLARAIADVPKLAKRTGYSELEVATYIWCAQFANAEKMHLPIKRDLNFSKL